jgi:hypothetical protein
MRGARARAARPVPWHGSGAKPFPERDPPMTWGIARPARFTAVHKRLGSSPQSLVRPQARLLAPAIGGHELLFTFAYDRSDTPRHAHAEVTRDEMSTDGLHGGVPTRARRLR